MRNHTLVDEAGLEKLKKFYQDQGVQVCGGLAYSVSEANGYQGFDYADPENRDSPKKPWKWPPAISMKSCSTITIFFDRKTDYDIKAKGNKSWTQYRLETMREVTKDLIVKPAKAVNPKCKVIIKMANWYDQYAGMGNDTEKVPLIADGMFSGTESRLWVGQEQHLQPYLSYDIMRFMDNLKPGVNKGGWVDQGGANPIDRYSEQLLDTVFSRCPEMCCFNYSGMLGAHPRSAPHNRAWADQPTSLNLAEVQKTSGPMTTSHLRRHRRLHARPSRQGAGQCRQARRHQMLHALSRHRRRVPARLPGHDRPAHGHLSAIPHQCRHGPADRAGQIRSRHHSTKSKPSSKPANRSASPPALCAP